MAGDIGEDIASLQNRLRRLEGQLRGIQRMLETGRHCDDVLTQIMAVRSAVDQVGLMMLDHHLEHCVLPGTPVDEVRLGELRRAMRMWMRFAPVGDG
ncbi:MAG TPA: metal-sensitive transcriptional regulator [Dehalococcoidia bacterium]|nr:metal-sensitive transcriptional regulator [Dehalococcoidia bacterium]